MKYVIISPRLGTPGDEFDPGDSNVDHLLAGGFIRQSTDKASKPSKVKTKPKE
jgi:hypothetical protein